jgi:alkanesulfonate monooxygenase SsuD/methylene tetrahydromethanopterin reductase-like flavin-dependent oxidoreductase (luciferase family)
VLEDPSSTIDRWFGKVQAAVGTPEQITEQIAAYQAEGCGYIIVNFPDSAVHPESMDMFAAEVMPNVS